MGNCRVNPYLSVDELYNGFQGFLIGSSSNEAVTAGPRIRNEPTGLPTISRNGFNVFIPLKKGSDRNHQTHIEWNHLFALINPDG
ncbi:hypothetical protein CDAR_604841 [Caerostris darwini]|uniref:Uncharacterized protein n=1 Tax=Caerostris darwini TaxID=1538125 RepID=A0AAV4VR30_9ARAC|nr:hypothetical protein CDAR_604841 [Caerostris darwini]